MMVPHVDRGPERQVEGGRVVSGAAGCSHEVQRRELTALAVGALYRLLDCGQASRDDVP